MVWFSHERVQMSCCRSSSADVSVTIDGSSCSVTTVTNTELECVTGPHAGSGVTRVEVEVSGNGIAEEVSTLTTTI